MPEETQTRETQTTQDAPRTRQSVGEAERARILLEVTSAVVSNLSLRDLMLAVSDCLHQFFNHDFASMILYEEESQMQAQLMSFFVNPPVSMLSGATTPIEGMPYWLQQVSYLNPVRHFSTIARGVMLKGVGLEVLYPNMLALAAFTLVIVGASVWRFRKQLS